MAEDIVKVDGGGSVNATESGSTPVREVATNNNTHAYISRIYQREENLFLEEYYSSTDVTIKFDDEEQTEIGYIQYAMQEQLKPIYGYASRTWDDVAVGNRIVTGVLKVPIRNIFARDYKAPENVDQGEFIRYQTSQYDANDPDGRYHKQQVVWQEEKISDRDIPEWISFLTPNGSVVSVLRPDEDYTGEIKYPININGSYYAYSPENSEDFMYRQKLQELGYDLSNGSSAYAFENVIKKFYNDMVKAGKKIDAGTYGKLTSGIKKAIDEACYEKWAEKDRLVIKKNSSLYTMPNTNGQVVITLPEDCEFISLDTIIDSNGYKWRRVIAKYSGHNYYGYYCEQLYS